MFSIKIFPNVCRLATHNRYWFGEAILRMRRQKEADLALKIKQGLNASFVSVTDTTIGSSSCGQMYNILVESPQFVGKSRVKQHQMVSELLCDEISQIHGFSLKTRTPKKPEQNQKQKPTDQQ